MSRGGVPALTPAPLPTPGRGERGTAAFQSSSYFGMLSLGQPVAGMVDHFLPQVTSLAWPSK
jgi:hypothetical protein